MNRLGRVLIVAIVIALVASFPFSARPVAAHAHVHVGPYEFTVGWREEPPTVGVMNGLDLFIAWEANQTPVDGAHQFLTANLTKGSAWYSPPLSPVFGVNGSYTFDVIPTEPGAYVVRIAGTLGGTPVNFTVDLQEVSPAADVEFPSANPTPGDLQGQIRALQGQATVLLIVASLGAVLAAAATAATVVLARRLRKSP